MNDTGKIMSNNWRLETEENFLKFQFEPIEYRENLITIKTFKYLLSTVSFRILHRVRNEITLHYRNMEKRIILVINQSKREAEGNCLHYMP